MLLQFLGPLLLMQFACGISNEGLLPREFIATPLNSSAISVSWKEPNRANELSGKYQLSLISKGRVKHYYLEDTGGQFSNLLPSTRYEFAVCAFWKNDTPVDDVVYAFAQTWPHDSEPSASPDLFEEAMLTDARMEVFTDSHAETASDKGSVASESPDQTEQDMRTDGRLEDLTDSKTEIASEKEGLLPREFIATALNSSDIAVSWKEPKRASELSGKYQLSIFTKGHRWHYYLEDTGGQFSNLRPSTRYEFSVCAFWKNDTPVDATAYAFAQTWPHGSAPSASPNLIEKDINTEGRADYSTDIHRDSTLDEGSASSDLPEEAPRTDVIRDDVTDSHVGSSLDKDPASLALPALTEKDLNTEVRVDDYTDIQRESTLNEAPSSSPDLIEKDINTEGRVDDATDVHRDSTMKKGSASSNLPGEALRTDVIRDDVTDYNAESSLDKGLALSASPELTDKDINAEISVDNATDIHSYSTLNEEGLIPRDFTATAVTSHSIIVSWEAPRRSNELNGLYELTVYNRTHEENSHLWATEDTITDLEPSTTYNFTVQAFWKNDTPVGVVAVTSARTNPKASALQQPTEDLHTEGRMPNSTDSHRDPTLDEEDLIPRDFTATAVNSHSIIVSWEAPRRSNDLNELYELTVSNGTHEENSYLWATEDTIAGLQPYTTYNFTVQAFWKNDTPVGVVAVTSARTMPRDLRSRNAFVPDSIQVSASNSPDSLTSHNPTSAANTKNILYIFYACNAFLFLQIFQLP